MSRLSRYSWSLNKLLCGNLRQGAPLKPENRGVSKPISNLFLMSPKYHQYVSLRLDHAQ